MTTLRFIDHGVSCNGMEPDPESPGKNRPCGATVWRTEVADALTTQSIGAFRALLRKRGWKLNTADDPRLDLDYCPKCADQA